MKRIYEYEDLQPVLEQLLNDKESSDLEFKSAKGGFPHSFWETYSSFANTDGGAIVFGIKEKDDQFYLDGVTEEQAKKYEKDFFNRMHSKESVQMCTAHLLESSGHGRGTKYHVYGLNVGLPDANVGLNVGLPDANVGLQKKRYSKEEMRSLIVSYCSEWRTAEEIALTVGRDTVYIRDRVLPQLSDVIEKMYDIPHHPRQKYRAKQKENEA